MIANTVTLDPVWPESLPYLGAMVGAQPFDRCVFCPPSAHPAVAGTYVRYGRHYVCLACARSLTRGAGAEVAAMLSRMQGNP